MIKFVSGKILIITMIISSIILINNGLCQQRAGIDQIDASSSFKLSGDTTPSNDYNTNVNINKTIDGTNGYPNLVYEINIPKVDYFDFILALDSSGSFSYGGENSQARAVAGAVPKFIGDLVNSSEYRNKDIKLSIISFDDNIDFAYSESIDPNPFNNTDIAKVKLANVSRVHEHIKNYSVFRKNNEKYCYYCNESEFTNLSIPINDSINILNNIKQDKFHRISKFIILVTGRSEFTNCSEELIKKAQEESIPIYVIGMDFTSDSDGLKMKDHLKKLGGYANYKYYRIQFVPQAPDSEGLEKNLINALKESLQNATKAPVANNVTVIESVYNYIDLNVDSIEVNGTEGEIYLINSSMNEDGTKTIAFELKKGLLPESKTIVTIPAELHLKGLPISIKRNSTPISYGPVSEKTPQSSIGYTWLDGYRGQINLKEGQLDIDINSPTKQNKNSQRTAKKSLLGALLSLLRINRGG